MRRLVTTSGEDAANLFLALSTTVSRVLIKEEEPPTLLSYDAASIDPTTLAASASSSCR